MRICWISEQNIAWYSENLFWLLLSRAECVVPWCHASMSSLASRFSWDIWFSVGAGAGTGARDTPKDPFHMWPALIIQGQFNIAPQTQSQLQPTCPAEKLLTCFIIINQLTLTTCRRKRFDAPRNAASSFIYINHRSQSTTFGLSIDHREKQIIRSWIMLII